MKKANGPDGRQLAIDFSQMASDHADSVHGNWSTQAWDFFLQFAKSRGEQDFLCEDVREASSGAVPPPPDERAWGTILMRASKKRLIKRIGYRPMRDPKCHANPKAIWVWQGAV
jgi:hypothetical protein